MTDIGRSTILPQRGLRTAMVVVLPLAFLMGFLAVSAVGAESGQDANPTPSSSRSAVISDTSFLFPDRPPLDSGGGEQEPPRDALSDQERRQIQAAIEANIRRLGLAPELPPIGAAAVPLGWPLRASERLADYGYHATWGFVDHDLNYPNQVLDYNCGNRTYDLASGYNHQGTDFTTWPFSWKKMDEDEVQVVAAAAGTIVGKQDGNYDRSCNFHESATWNAVYVRHADGSVAWYGHLKNGSLTTKPVGSNVQAGEYLGIVGSSGRSSGPHLHFELYDAASNLVDPYAGPCNSLSPGTWWMSQPAYYDPGINLVTTGDAQVEFRTCPDPAITHIADDFSHGDTVYFTTYYRDLLVGQVSQFTIYRPDASVFQSWTHSSTTPHSAAAYRWWSYPMGSEVMTGTWRFEVVYEGLAYQTFFNVGDPIYISVTSPSTGSVWLPGSTQTIEWDDNLGGHVRLELYAGAAYLATISNSVPSQGTYTWMVPADLPVGSAYRVRVVDLANDRTYADSAFFGIGEPSSTYLPAVLKGH